MATASDACGFCFVEPVFGSCENCNIRLGERCFSNHSKIALFTGHILFPLDNTENKKHLPVHIEKDIHELKCQVHETDHQSLYCVKHDVAICGRCILADHITCTNEIVDLHTTKFDEQRTNAVLGTLKEIETEINDLQVRVEENVRLNDKCKASSLDAIKEYRKKIDSRLDQLQLAAEQATEEKHKENMNSLIEVARTCKDGSLRIQERGKTVDELSKKRQERRLFIYAKKLAIEIDEIRTAIKQSNFKNHITQFKFKKHPTLENTLQEEILEIGTLQATCDGSDEIVDDINSKLTGTPADADKGCAGEMTKQKKFASGNQPPGKMTVSEWTWFEDKIRITYEFLDGQQSGGKMYKGITKDAYLPYSVQGQNICRMLKVAFQRKLVFNINSDGVIVYNGIEHSSIHRAFKRPFHWAFPDRVTAQLKAKGITLADIDTNDEWMGTVTAY